MSNDLISRKALIGKDGLFAQRGCPGNCQYCNLWTEDGCRVILESPTVDAVEVVRCKNCKHGEIDDPDFPNQYYCHEGCGWNDADFYCSYGERKDGEIE